MTTAYTSLLGLALPVTGELSGTWGDTVNNSITSLLDSAIAGTTTLSSDVDVTLTTTTGASNTSRQAILLWTAGGTVTRNITAPAQSKIYTVINASSSTQSIVLRGAGPTTGVTIVKGESAVCAWNGSDFIKISNTGGAAVFTTLDVTNLEVTNIKALDGTSAASIANSTGVISLTANPILSGGTANGVAYLNTSKQLTTGSALVFDGTNLGLGVTPSAFWSAYKVLEMGSLGNSIGAVNGGSQIQVSANAFQYGPGTYKYGQTGYAASLYSQSNGSHSWSTAASGTAGNAITFTQAMTLDASGQLGIGVTSMSYPLDVKLANNQFILARESTSNITNGFRIGGPANESKAVFSANSATGEVNLGAINTNYFLTFSTNGANERARIDSSGNLGLGVTPSAWSGYKSLDLQGGSFASGSGTNVEMWCNSFYNGTNSVYRNTGFATLYNQSSGTHKWYNAPSGTAGNSITFTQAMTLDASGQLGVGTTSPSAIIHSSSSGLGDGGGIKIQNTGSGGATFAIWPTATVNGEGAGKLIISGPSGNAVALDSSGNLGIGTTSPNRTGFTSPVLSITNGTSGIVELIGTQAADGTVGQIAFYNTSSSVRIAQILGVRSGANNSGALTFQTNNAGTLGEAGRFDASGNLLVARTSASDTTVGFTAYSNGTVTCARSSSTNGDLNLYVYSTGAAAARFYVGMAGTVYATSTTITAISDVRLKENIRDLDDGLNAVMALKPRKFDWKAGKGKDKKDDRGWIAQEFEQVFPDMVDTWADPAPEGEEPYKAVNADLIPTLVKAIQEQQALIVSMREEIDALKTKVGT